MQKGTFIRKIAYLKLKDIYLSVDVKLFKWSNAIEHISENKKMIIAFEKFKERIEQCDWNSPSDIMKSFRTADTITCKGRPFNRVVFNVGGNKYRMICGYKFGSRNVVLYIRFIGTHTEYDIIEPCKINLF